MIVLEGNHDHRGKSEKGSALDPFREISLPHVRFVSGSPVYPSNLQVLGQRFLAIPHVSTEVLDREMSGILEDLNKATAPVIGLCHLEIAGATMGVESYMIRHRPGVLPLELICHPKIAFWLAGHIHKPQILVDGRVVVVGSLIQHDFGEAGEEKRFVTIQGNPPSIRQTHRVPGPCLKKLELDFTDPSQEAQTREAHHLLTSGQFRSLDLVENDLVQINVRVTEEEHAKLDFTKIEKRLRTYCRLPRPITPTIVRSREYRMKSLVQTKPDVEIAADYIWSRARQDAEEIIKKAESVICPSGEKVL